MTQPINTRQEAELAKLQAETAKILLDLTLRRFIRAGYPGEPFI